MELLEIVFIMAVLLVVFGPEKLPDLARHLGEAFYEFRKASSTVIEGVASPSVTKNADVEDVNRALEETEEKLNANTKEKNINQITRKRMDKVDNKNAER